MAKKEPNRYQAILQAVFDRHYKAGVTQFEFTREEFAEAAGQLRIEVPKNLGDLLYAFRFRWRLPQAIAATAGEGREWIIELAGKAKYRFRQTALTIIAPNPNMIAIKIPDATPEIVSAYALSDEQALLAKVRYNRLVDIFIGVTAYSLQNHLRTTVKSMGDSQIEIDELYVGVNKHGEQFALPVQAKGGNDPLSAVQTAQDAAFCKEKFAGLTCRPISAQFMADDTIAMFELAMDGEDVKLVEEKHYRLVPSDKISAADLKRYSKR